MAYRNRAVIRHGESMPLELARDFWSCVGVVAVRLFIAIYPAWRWISSRMSSTCHAVQLAESLTGFGKRPDLMPAHHVLADTG